MKLLDSLLDAIIRLDGDALVMHVGEKPYVVTTSNRAGQVQGTLAGRVELSSRVLTSAAVAAMINRMLPPDHRAALARSGAAECDVAAVSDPAERFTVVAFRGGDDVWLEVRRGNRPASAASFPPADQVDHQDAERGEGARLVEPAVDTDADDSDDVMTEGELSEMLRTSSGTVGIRGDSPGVGAAVSAHAAAPQDPSTAPEASGPFTAPRSPALIVPLARADRPGSSDETGDDVGAIWPRAVQLAVARGAAALYLVAHSAAMARVGGEFIPLGGLPVIDAPVLERLTAALRATGSAAPTGVANEWITDVPGCGRIRCLAFRDQRGPGLLCRMLSARVLSADQLGLTPEVHALCSEADGLVLVAGGRRSGKSTLIASLVDLINRTRTDHVITVESQLEVVHDERRSLVSQREIRGDDEACKAAVRAAIREEPDVLVIDELRSPGIVALAIEAAESGTLVLGAMQAASTAAAVQRILEMVPPERRDQARAQLAGVLRGVIALILLRKRAGGRVPAREILLNTPAVAHMLLEGRTAELPAAIDGGRRQGMVPFAETLAALVRSGTVHPSHACRNAPSREPFLAALRRDGVATDVLERFA